jgi:tetratricopeptide (TPR) repeat protein
MTERFVTTRLFPPRSASVRSGRGSGLRRTVASGLLVCLLAATAHPDAASANASLVAVPVPKLAGAEASVARALGAARAQLDALVAREDVGPHELAEAYGETGLLYHAHVAFDAAEACYQNAMVLAPDDFRWPYLLAYVHQQNGRLEEAARYYRTALAIQPGHLPAKLRLAEVYIELEQLERAEPLLEAAVSSDELKARALSGLGQIALARRDYQRAATLLEQALAAAPDASRLHYTLAMAYRGLKDLERARFHLEQRGEAEPQIPDSLIDGLRSLSTGPHTLYRYAMSAVRGHRYDAAVEAFSEALKMEPGNANAQVSLARALYLAGDRVAAEETLERVLTQNPDHPLANFLLGVMYEQKRSPDRAIALYRRALQAEPAHAGAHYHLANALARSGHYEAAAPHYAQTLQQAPDMLRARTMEVIALMRSGAPRAVIQARLEAARDRYPDNELFAYCLALLLAAGPEDSVGDAERAVTLGTDLYEQAPVPEHIELVAMAYAAMGKFEEAVPTMETALASAAALQAYKLVPRLEAELKAYQQGKPTPGGWRERTPRLEPPPTDAVAVFRDYPSDTPY